jgi:hypothetical protein
MAEKKEIEKQISEHERIVELIGCWLSFPSKPWWSWVESHRIGGLARALGVLQDPPSSPVAGIATTMMVGPSLWAPGVRSPRPRRPALSLSCQCPLGMCMVLFVGSHRNYFSCPCSDRSHTTSALIVRWPAARSVTSLYLGWCSWP